MDWEVGGVTWSPWNGVTLKGVKMLQPEVLRELVSSPVLEVEQMQVQPYWSQLLRGRLRLRDILIDSPKLTVAVEMLAVLADSGVGGEPQPSAIPSVESEPIDLSLADAGSTDELGADAALAKDESGAGKLNKGKLNKGKLDPSPSPSSAAGKKQTASNLNPGNPVPPERLPAGLPLNLHIKNASLDLVSANREIQLFQLEGADLELPLLGEDAAGILKVGSLKIPRVPSVTDLQQTISWKRPYLQCENPKADMGGLTFSYRVQLGLGSQSRGGLALPFLLDFVLPSQKVSEVQWLNEVALEAEADEVVGRFRCSGMLQSPVTWRANMLMLGSKIKVKESHGGRDISFDEVVVPAMFRRGTLQWSGLRLIGEDVSVMGNGRLSVRGGVLAVTRLVVSPEVGQMVSRALDGAGFVRHGTRWWDDLETPDRKIRDLLVSGTLQEPMIDAGYQYRELPVWELVGTTYQFIWNEMKEEELGLGGEN